MWFKVDTLVSSGFDKLFQFGNGAPKDNIGIGRQGTTDGLYMEVWQGTAWSGFTLAGEWPTQVPSAWKHVVWTITRPTPTATSGTHRLYTNNVLKTTQDAFFPLVATSSNYIANSPWGDNFQGKIDSFSIYPWALGPSEVLLLFGATGNKVTYHTRLCKTLLPKHCCDRCFFPCLTRKLQRCFGY